MILPSMFQRMQTWTAVSGSSRCAGSWIFPVFLGALFLASYAGAVAAGAQADEPPAFDAETLQALEWEQRVIDARLAIRSGRADLLVERQAWSGNGTRHESTLHRRAFFEDDKIRTEIWLTNLDPESVAPTNVAIKNGTDYFHRGIGQGGIVPSAEVRHADDPANMRFDLRILGMAASPTSVLHSLRGLDHLLCRRIGRVVSKMTEVELDGRPMLLITTENQSGFVVRLWIDKDRGPVLVRAEVEGMHQKIRLLDTMENRLERVDGVWFPRSVKYTRHTDGILLMDHLTTLNNLALNVDIEDELFTLPSLGVKPGDHVQELPEHSDGVRIWDGHELVPASKARRDPAAGPANPEQNPWRVVLVGGNVLLAAVFLAVYLRRRRARRGGEA